MTTPATRRLGPYEVRERIGAGGMGEVFRARDDRIGRDVAIKVLKPSLAADAGRLERFKQEARAAGSVGHPNLVTIYDIGSEEGSPYIVMEWLDGATLRDRLNAPLEDLNRQLLWLADVADAIAAAHAAGIVHRDLKPENIIITSSGVAKILDFGLAKLQLDDASESTAALMTTPGTILGTVGYMSPEQAQGRTVDHRSDIFSLGSILYEMLTGCRAFDGTSAVDTLHKIIHDDPPPPASVGREIPAELVRISRRCLSKAPNDRYQSARDLALDLRNAVAPSRHDSLMPALSNATPAPVARRTAVAVLPFANLTPDPDNVYLCEGVTEDLLTELSRIATLKVVSRASALRFQKRDQSTTEIASALNADVLVEGSVRRIGTRVRIAARVVDGRRDEQLWADACEGSVEEIFEIQKRVAQQVAATLAPDMSRSQRAKVGRPATTNVEARRLQQQGRHCMARLTEEGIRQAIACFERAAALDPKYASPHAGIAVAYYLLGDGHGASKVSLRDARTKAMEAIDRALAIDPLLSEAHMAEGLLLTSEFEWTRSERAFQRSIALDPDAAKPLDCYALLLGAVARYDEALSVLRRAHELDPLEPVIMSDIASTLLRAGRYDEALEQSRALLGLEPAYPLGHSTLAWAHIKKGEHREGLPELEEAVRLSPGNTMLLGQLGQALAMAGRSDEAKRILDDLTAQSAKRYISPYHLAYIYTGLRDDERAIDCLEQAVDQGAGGVYGIKGSFLFTDLRPHPRFQALLARMNL